MIDRQKHIRNSQLPTEAVANLLLAMRVADPQVLRPCFIPGTIGAGADGAREAPRELKGALLGQIRACNQAPFLRGSD